MHRPGRAAHKLGLEIDDDWRGLDGGNEVRSGAEQPPGFERFNCYRVDGLRMISRSGFHRNFSPRSGP